MSFASKALYGSLWRAWLWVGVILLPLTWWGAYSVSWPADAYLYDKAQSLQTRPASPAILLVAIDELSLRHLGQWPWPRSVHARLVEQLADAGVISVLFDVIFAEPSRDPVEDTRLSEEIQRHGHVFLPLMRLPSMSQDSQPNILLPIEPLRSAARDIGHINVAADPDGMVRSIFLREGAGQERWPQLAWRVYEDAAARGYAPRHAMPGRGHEGSTEHWIRDHQVRIPYRGEPGHYPTVSYLHVLRGEVPADVLRDRIILVGATAAGMGDRHPISLAGMQGSMAGVEMQAHLLDGLLSNQVIIDVEAKMSAWLAVLPLAALLLAVWWLKFRYLPWLVVATLFTVAGGTWLALSQGWWWPPTASIAAILAAFVLMSWRSQAAALSWFQHEIGRIEQEPQILPGQQPYVAPGWGGALQQRIFVLSRAVARLRDTRQFTSEALEAFPVALFVTTADGGILLANQHANVILNDNQQSHTRKLDEFLASLSPEKSRGNALGGEVKGTLKDLHGITYEDRGGRCFRLEVAPLNSAIKEVSTGWLVGLIDMTHEKLAEKQRAHMLRFLSHDLRAPQSSVLALVELQKMPGHSLPEGEFFQRVTQLVGHSLALTEEFMQLAKMEFSALNFGIVMLVDVAMEARDQAWPLAQQRNIRLEYNFDDEDEGCLVWGDRLYLVRAVFNLLDNAIKYTPPGTCVTVSVWQKDGQACCEVRDQGDGISQQDIPYIFESYRRITSGTTARGYGLGLALVKAVADKHQGEARCVSEPGQGSRFLLSLPAWRDSEDRYPVLK